MLGRIHLAAGQSTEAIIRFRQAVHLDPYHGYALNNLGLAYLQTSQDAQAAEVLAQAAYLLPHVGYVHNNLGLAYERLGRLEEARMAFDTATAPVPERPQGPPQPPAVESRRPAPPSISRHCSGTAQSPGCPE